MEQLKIFFTSRTHGHMHTWNPLDKVGYTSMDKGHNHKYKKNDKETEPAKDGHTHRLIK